MISQNKVQHHKYVWVNQRGYENFVAVALIEFLNKKRLNGNNPVLHIDSKLIIVVVLITCPLDIVLHIVRRK